MPKSTGSVLRARPKRRPGPLQGLERKRQRSRLRRPRGFAASGLPRGCQQIRRQGRQGQGDDHHFRGHRHREQLDDQHFRPQQGEDCQVDVDAHAADDQVRIGVGVDRGQDQDQGQDPPRSATTAGGPALNIS